MEREPTQPKIPPSSRSPIATSPTLNLDPTLPQTKMLCICINNLAKIFLLYKEYVDIKNQSSVLSPNNQAHK